MILSMQYILFGTWLLLGIAAEAVSSYSSGADSGDFLVSTASYAAFLDPEQDVDDTGTRFGLAAVSPSGSVRFAVEFNISYTRTPLQTSLSPDGKYAFTTVRTLDAGKEMGIYVTRIKGSNPKVIQTITVPPKKYCSYPNQNSQINAPIAVGSESDGDNYVIYVARECDERLDNKISQRFSIEVLKLRYSSSTGNITILNEKPYFRNGLNKSPGFSAFRTLQVINGEPYGLLYGGTTTIKVLRLEGSKIPTLASSSPKFGDCDRVSFSIASPKHVYGACFLGQGKTYHKELVSVDDDKITWGPQKSEGTVAVDQKSSNVYTFIRSKPVRTGTKDDSGLTLYKIDSTKFQAPPKAIFKLAPILVSNPIKNQGNVEIKELLVVP